MTRPPAIYAFVSSIDVWVGRGRVAASGPAGERLLSGDAIVEVAMRLAESGGESGQLTIAQLMQGTGGVQRVAALQQLRAAGIVDRLGLDAPVGGSAVLPDRMPAAWPTTGIEHVRPLLLVDLLAAPVAAGASPLLVLLEGEPANALDAMDRHLRGSAAWLPLQLHGATPWVGPLFGVLPGGGDRADHRDPQGPCAQCLAIRLRGRHEVAVVAQADAAMHRVQVGVPPRRAERMEPLLAELARRLAPGGDAAPLRAAMCRSTRHGLTWHAAPRGVCPRCRTDVDPTPRTLVERLDRLSDPLTGCLAVIGMVTPPDAPLQMAAAHTLPVARWVTLPPPTMDELGRTGRLAGVSSGIGLHRDIARLAARMEALEGYAGLWRGDADGAPRRAAWSALAAGAALSPSALLAFSGAQVAAEGPELAALLDPDVVHAWWPATGSDGGTALVPLALAYDGVPEPGARWWVSNGVAAGATPDGAMVHALCELIERDATAIWWHNALSRPRLPLPDDDDTAIAAIAAHQGSGREVALLDLTHDLGIAVRAAVAWDAAGGGGITMGFAADSDPRRADRRALVESCRVLPAYQAWRMGRVRRGRLPAWFADTRVDDLPWLLAGPAFTAPPVLTAMAPDGTAASALHTVRAALARAGLAPWVIDLTRPDVGIPVVKVFVPGLRFRNQFAPGRLYDVPVTLGWLAAPRTEREMLPFPDGLR